VTAVLDSPVATVNLKNSLGVGLLRRPAGNAIGDFTRADAGFFLCRVPFDGERLSDVGKVKVVVELGGSPDLSGFDSSMVRRRILNEVGLLPILEE
jgi:hypothetical protein